MININFQIHSTPGFGLHLASWIQSSDSATFGAEAKYLFKLELEYHNWHTRDAHSCLKRHLGTNENTQKFYAHLGCSREVHGLVNSSLWKNIVQIYHLINKSSFGVTMMHAIKLLAQLIAHSWDMIKDVYFLIIYSQFFPISRNSFSTFPFQLFFLLLLSVLLPHLLNIVVLIFESPTYLSRKGKMILIIFASVSHTVLGYAINKIRMTKAKLKMASEYQNKKLMKTLKAMDQQSYSLARLQSKLWLNEGVFESTIQALLLLIAIAMRFR